MIFARRPRTTVVDWGADAESAALPIDDGTESGEAVTGAAAEVARPVGVSR